jgi:hypothetical protein
VSNVARARALTPRPFRRRGPTMGNEVAESRGPLLTTLAVLMGLLAFSNFLKPLGQAMSPQSSAGFVFFGHRLHGLSNAVIGPLFGVVLAAYAYGVWNRRGWVIAVAVLYAIYVILNLILFMAIEPPGQRSGPGFMLIYAAVAIGVSGGGALYLLRHRDLFR